LRLKSAIELAKMFGASIHASLRRMVERNDRRCALLVLSSDNESTPWLPRLKLKNYFQSDSFTKEFGYIKWASPMELDLDFVRDHMSKRKFLTSTFSKKIEGKDLQLGYDYFDNKYNVFVLLYPIGENCV